MTTLNDLPKTGIAGLESVDAEGIPKLALSYDLARRGNRQALLRAVEQEISRGRTVTLTLPGG